MKESVSIPVIGNGDIKSCYDAKRMLDETNCDAIMIGRGCLGNPWLIKQCVDYLELGVEPRGITKEDKLNMIDKHFDYLLKTKVEKVAVLEMRSHIAWYLKGIPGAAKVKDDIFKTKDINKIKQILKEFKGD